MKEYTAKRFGNTYILTVLDDGRVEVRNQAGVALCPGNLYAQGPTDVKTRRFAVIEAARQGWDELCTVTRLNWTAA